MSRRTSTWPAGVPCWADLSSPDLDAARRFYADVLGWQFQESGQEYGGYLLATVDGASAAGIGPVMAPDQPVAWTLYLASDDADATAAAITQHGGSVLLPAMDVGPLGRMLVATDPTGAAFGVWQGREHTGAQVVNEPGALTWEDLRSPDPERAREFYRGVFGYRTDALDGAGPDYTTFALPGEEWPLGGMGALASDDGAGPRWLVYFGVADAGAAAQAAGRTGGRVVTEPFDTPYGTMAGLADPAGAQFWVVATDRAGNAQHTG